MATQLKLFGKSRAKFRPTKAQINEAKKKGGLVLKPAKKTRGKSKTKADAKRKALQPGKRLSRTGKVYYETRTNRADKKKK
jgi:hypothetical protein